MILLPLLVVRHATVVHAALSSKKTAEKTLETGILWEVHPSMHRVIPAQPSIAIERVCRAPSWYVAYVAKDAEFSKSELVLEEGNAPTYDNECKVLVAENILNSALSNGQTEKRATYADDHSMHDNAALFLHTLYDIVAQRNRMRPQGSYTSHLFASGGAKIRKKFCEEAIEVILAQSDEELSSEVADLLYHLIVLLVHNGISLKACIEILKQRHVQ